MSIHSCYMRNHPCHLQQIDSPSHVPVPSRVPYSSMNVPDPILRILLSIEPVVRVKHIFPSASTNTTTNPEIVPTELPKLPGFWGKDGAGPKGSGPGPPVNVGLWSVGVVGGGGGRTGTGAGWKVGAAGQTQDWAFASIRSNPINPAYRINKGSPGEDFELLDLDLDLDFESNLLLSPAHPNSWFQNKQICHFPAWEMLHRHHTGPKILQRIQVSEDLTANAKLACSGSGEFLRNMHCWGGFLRLPWEL